MAISSDSYGTAGMSTRGANVIGGRDNTSGPGPEIMAADTLEGDEVVNLEGDKLGKIQDIMLDVPHGRIAYAVLSSGGFLGMGDTLHAIPWSALTMDADQKCFVLDVEKDRFRDAPGFDKDHWPSMADASWAQEVHQYYNRSPYWDSPLP